MAYSLFDYGRMIQDQVRIDAYNGALERALAQKPNATVLELGTGTGIVAFFANQKGAKKVFAIEPNDNIEIAQLQKKANAQGDEIQFIRAFSDHVVLGEKADILISDMRGVLPMLDGHLSAIIDARKRLLKPEGIQISQRDTLFCALAHAPKIYRTAVGHWDESPAGVSMSVAREKATQTWYSRPVPAEGLRSKPEVWAQIDYRTITSPHVEGQAKLRAASTSLVHGCSLWFDTQVDDHAQLTNAPWADKLAYGHCFFPFEEPLSLNEGDTVHMRFSARQVAGRYVWRWRTEGKGRKFDQSTFYSTPLTQSVLSEHKGEQKRVLTDEGKTTLFILKSLHENMSPKDIALELRRDFPERYETEVQALTAVLHLARDHSRPCT